MGLIQKTLSIAINLESIEESTWNIAAQPEFQLRWNELSGCKQCPWWFRERGGWAAEALTLGRSPQGPKSQGLTTSGHWAELIQVPRAFVCIEYPFWLKISRLFTCLMKVNDPVLGEGWWDGAGGEGSDGDTPHWKIRICHRKNATLAYWLFWASNTWETAGAERALASSFSPKSRPSISSDKVLSPY